MVNEWQSSIVNKASVLMNQGRYKEAAQILQDSLSSEPNDAYVLNLLAYCQLHTNRQKEALQTVNTSISLEPFASYHYDLKALILIELNKFQEALKESNQALAISPESSHTFAVQSLIFIRMKKWVEAENTARRALAIDANNLFAGNMLTTALRMQNKLQESTHLVSDILSRDPEDAVSHCSAGWLYLSKGDYKKAQAHFNESLRLDPNFDPARAGMLETFKAQSKFYSWYLKYTMFMSRQAKGKQWMIILGIYILFQLMGSWAKTLFTGPAAIIGYTVIVLIYVFFFWTWLSRALGNLIVYTNPMARHALNKTEKIDALMVGGLFTVGIMALAIAVILKLTSLAYLSGAMILATIPFAVTFMNDHRIGKIVYGAVGFFILGAGLLMAIGLLGHVGPILGLEKVLLNTVLLSFIVVTWLGAFGAMID